MKAWQRIARQGGTVALGAVLATILLLLGAAAGSLDSYAQEANASSASRAPQGILLAPSDVAVVYDPAAGDAYARAAQVLAKYFTQMSGHRFDPVAGVKDLPAARLMILIGDVEHNRVTQKVAQACGRQDLTAGLLPEDGFFIKTVGGGAAGSSGTAGGSGAATSAAARAGQQEYLVLGGNGPRAILYAVYHYLQDFLGVGYFEDGDVVPERTTLDGQPIDVTDAPRFPHRLYRLWSAPRTLSEYSPHWWSLEQWQRELDWAVKRGFNEIVLSMTFYSGALGDAEKVIFPELPWPPPAGLYQLGGELPKGWDWPPQYRRELTQKVLAYGRQLGLKFVYEWTYGAMDRMFTQAHPELTYLQTMGLDNYPILDPREAPAEEYTVRFWKGLVSLFGTDHLYRIGLFPNDTSSTESILEALRRISSALEAVDSQAVWYLDAADLAGKGTGDSGETAGSPAGSAMEADASEGPARERAAEGPGIDPKVLAALPKQVRLISTYPLKAAVPLVYAPENPAPVGAFGPFGNLSALADAAQKVATAAAGPPTGYAVLADGAGSNWLNRTLQAALAWDPARVRFAAFLDQARRERFSGTGADDPNLAASLKAAVQAMGLYGPQSSDGLAVYPFPYYLAVGSQGRFWLMDNPYHQERAFLLTEILAKSVPLWQQALTAAAQVSGPVSEQAAFQSYVREISVAYLNDLSNLQMSAAYLAFKNQDAAGLAAASQHALRTLEVLEKVLAADPSLSYGRTVEEAARVPGSNPSLPESIRLGAFAAGTYYAYPAADALAGLYLPNVKAYLDTLASRLSGGVSTLDADLFKAGSLHDKISANQASWLKAGGPQHEAALASGSPANMAKEVLAATQGLAPDGKALLALITTLKEPIRSFVETFDGPFINDARWVKQCIVWQTKQPVRGVVTIEDGKLHLAGLEGDSQILTRKPLPDVDYTLTFDMYPIPEEAYGKDVGAEINIQHQRPEGHDYWYLQLSPYWGNKFQIWASSKGQWEPILASEPNQPRGVWYTVTLENHKDTTTVKVVNKATGAVVLSGTVAHDEGSPGPLSFTAFNSTGQPHGVYFDNIALTIP